MRRAKDAELGGSSAFVDARLAEPKAHYDKPAAASSGSSLPVALTRIAAAVVVCHLLGVLDLPIAAFSSVRCEPAVVRAGQNVTCFISTAVLSSDADISITQTGTAGKLEMLSEAPHAYRVAFLTRATGTAGVTLSHSFFTSRASVEVAAGPATHVEVACAPPLVAPGATVECPVTPRDAFGNAADVARPAAAPESYFSVSSVGCATNLAVHDTYVSFVASPSGTSSTCGVAVTLDGKRKESTVRRTT